MQLGTKFDATLVAADAVPDALGGEDRELLERLRSGTIDASDGAAARELTGRLVRAIEAGAVGPVARVAAHPVPMRPDRQALKDPELDEQLRSEGWAKVRVLTREQAAALREVYGEVHGWEGEGFEPDPANGDREYRTRSRAALGAVLDPALAEVFVDHLPFLQGYYLKWPNCPETHIHADWTNVDETAGHRSYIAWTALQDITDDVGQMSILPRSHTVDPSPRGSRLNLPLAGAWLGKEEDVWRRMQRVPLEAGEALVFDMGTIHASFSNTTDLPRVAAVTCLRPAEAELVYYRAASGDTVLRYEVDEEFFVEATPPELVDVLPCRLPNAVLAVGTTAESVRRAEELLGSLEPIEEPPAEVLEEQRALSRSLVDAGPGGGADTAAGGRMVAPAPEPAPQPAATVGRHGPTRRSALGRIGALLDRARRG